jgi:hypothetical protein
MAVSKAVGARPVPHIVTASVTTMRPAAPDRQPARQARK